MRLGDGQTLLEKTYTRAAGCSHAAEVLTITNRDYYFQSKDCWTDSQHGNAPGRFLLEPFGRNTAPAILMGALMIRALHGDQAIMLVLPSDHLIQDADSFHQDVEVAFKLAQSGRLVTFGITPTHPETGFGYIQSGMDIENGQARTVARFIEKPGRERAQAMLDEGGYYWNSGMFCFKVGVLIEAFGLHVPTMLQQAEACWEATSERANEAYTTLDEEAFAQLDDVSIDYAVMEKAANVAVVPAQFDWSDIGSWNALAQIFPEDDAGNRTQGEVVHIDTRGCFIQSEDRLVATIGLEDLVIIDTPDALLVSRRDQTQRVKEVVGHLKELGHDCYRLHRTVARPWGTYTVLEEGSRYKIKRIEVRPGASLSLQMHHHRSEHWIVVSGTAKIVNGDQEMLIHPNQSTYIAAGHPHRLENPGVIDLVMIEVQSGEYLGEDDIVRFHDQYGRA
jgi:mannose-1-phosphate guanylyltransferase